MEDAENRVSVLAGLAVDEHGLHAFVDVVVGRECKHLRGDFVFLPLADEGTRPQHVRDENRLLGRQGLVHGPEPDVLAVAWYRYADPHWHAFAYLVQVLEDGVLRRRLFGADAYDARDFRCGYARSLVSESDEKVEDGQDPASRCAARCESGFL